MISAIITNPTRQRLRTSLAPIGREGRGEGLCVPSSASLRAASQSEPRTVPPRTQARGAYKALYAPVERVRAKSFAIPKERLAAIWTEPALSRFGVLLSEAAEGCRRVERKRLEREAIQAECESLLARLRLEATRLQWSGRRLAKEIGIPECSMRAISKRRVQPGFYLPCLRAAVSRFDLFRPVAA